MLIPDYTKTANEIIFIGDVVELVDPTLFSGEQWPHDEYVVYDRRYVGFSRYHASWIGFVVTQTSNREPEPDEGTEYANGWMLSIERYGYTRVFMDLRREHVRLVRRGGGTAETKGRFQYLIEPPSGIQPGVVECRENTTFTSEDSLSIPVSGDSISTSVSLDNNDTEGKQPSSLTREIRPQTFGVRQSQNEEMFSDFDQTQWRSSTHNVRILVFPEIHERTWHVPDYWERGVNQLTNRDQSYVGLGERLDRHEQYRQLQEQ